MSEPWFKFYPTDWRSDPKLRMCGLTARGLWIEMLALMHEAVPYGHLLISGHSPTDTQLAVLVGTSPDQIPELIGELESAGVFSRTREGVIFSRKMTRVAQKSAIARKNGKNGGNPSLRKQTGNPASDNQPHNRRDKPQKLDTRIITPLPPSGPGTDDALFDEIWRTFPKADTSNPKTARGQFNMLSPQQRKHLLQAAQRYRQWWIEDCERRKEPQDSRRRFVPHLAKWIQSGAWEHADDLPVRGYGSSAPLEGIEYVDRYADEDLFKACEALVGKPVATGIQRYAFPSEIVQQARKGKAA